MSWLPTIFVLGGAFLAVFWASVFHGLRHLLGAQIDLLPPLMVYASLNTGFTTVAALAVLGGLWFDSLSANPLGISVLPLLAVGLTIYSQRELILREQVFAQIALGLGASAAVPIMVLVWLLTTGREPLLGWGTIWQVIVMTAGGAIATPILFEIFGLLHRALGYQPTTHSSFRPDREIRRGRM